MKYRIAHQVSLIMIILTVTACVKSTITGSTSQPPIVETPITQLEVLTIANTSSFIDAFGTFHVVGELKNYSNEVLNSIELTIEIRDASGNSLIKDENGEVTTNAIFYPMLYTLAPGEASPFEYSYDTNYGTPASFNVIISGQVVGGNNRATLVEENIQIVDDGSGRIYLTGELVNTGNQWAHINSLAGGVLDDANNLLSADWTVTFTTELAPAGDPLGRNRTPFEIDFPNPGGGTQWKLYYDADMTENVIDYPIEIKVTNYYIDENASAHLIGWITNKSDQPLDSLVVAGLYAEDGTVLDSSYAFIPVPIEPGLAAPFNISTFWKVNNNPDLSSQVNAYSIQYDPWFTSITTNEYVELSATGEIVEKVGGTWTFNGDVPNSSGRNLSGATVAILIMDGQNNLIATQFTSIYPSGDAILPGEINTYSVSVNLDPAVDTSNFITETIIIGDIK
jgi:hypothetical protein